jgi:anti-sigma B factor antagonist
MNTNSARLLVLVGQEFACVKIIGRANFNSSIDFKTLVGELRQKGFAWFVLDLSECTLMDSTFLGVLAGFGIKMGGVRTDSACVGIELLNPNPRITELLENLGVLHLFRLTQGPLPSPGETQPVPVTPANPSREEVSRACLEAHLTLADLSITNKEKFKDVIAFLAEDLKKLKAEHAR